ncbi:uncharacterized protein Pyn_34924 [Prunus yedoensis var. nudiflora]|uniref:Uncharacterized protein n=1 Tax=Prunus yedoensis var. nudiflora TaxID=2094558 RepID=A0A314Y339_PRUYE|nr:uncharacterized protein Pyn_34924 [Prunus yedoensis var. nudiflora]
MGRGPRGFERVVLDNTEQIEDAVTGLKLEDLFSPKKVGDATEPSKVNHELLIELLEGTMGLWNVERYYYNIKDKIALMGCAHLLLNHGGSAYMAWADIAVLHPRIFPNDVYINDILDAAKALRKSSLQWFVTKVQDRIVLCTMRRLVVKNANKSRHTLEYLDKDETVVAHVVGGVDAFIKVSVHLLISS